MKDLPSPTKEKLVENSRLSATKTAVIPKRPKRRRDRKDTSVEERGYNDTRDSKLERLQRNVDDLQLHCKPEPQGHEESLMKRGERDSRNGRPQL